MHEHFIPFYFLFSNFTIQLLTLTILLSFLGTKCELTESVIFQPIDDRQTSKSSWIFSTAVDFTSYLTSLNSVFDYGMNVKEQSLTLRTHSTTNTKSHIKDIKNY